MQAVTEAEAIAAMGRKGDAAARPAGAAGAPAFLAGLPHLLEEAAGGILLPPSACALASLHDPCFVLSALRSQLHLVLSPAARPCGHLMCQECCTWHKIGKLASECVTHNGTDTPASSAGSQGSGHGLPKKTRDLQAPLAGDYRRCVARVRSNILRIR